MQSSRVDGVATSFNGGKDSSVVLYLYYAVIGKYLRQVHYPNQPFDLTKYKHKAVYVRPPKPFPEVEQFIERCKSLYVLLYRIVGF